MGFRVFDPDEFKVEVTSDLIEEGEKRLDEIVEDTKEEDAEKRAAIYTILFGLVVFSITAYYFWNFINGNW